MKSRVLIHPRLACGWLAVVFCVAVFTFTSRGNCQLAGAGSIQGSVADATGAVIPNATVTVTNTATQVKHNAVTGGSGLYSFPNLDVGTYTLEVAAPGFEHYSQSNVVLEVGSSIAINVPMTVGRTDQKIEVQASGLALQTEDATFKQTIDQQTLTEMPLNGRQMTDLITLSGGSTSAPAGDFTGSKYSYQTISVSIAGGMGNTTLWRLDGGDNQDYMANGNLPFPFPGCGQPVQRRVHDLGAQDGMHYGRHGQRRHPSGTNQYHGRPSSSSATTIIDATNFFSATKDTLHQNQFGGTFGGPILQQQAVCLRGYQRTDANQSQSARRPMCQPPRTCWATCLSQMASSVTGSIRIGQSWPFSWSTPSPARSWPEICIRRKPTLQPAVAEAA